MLEAVVVPLVLALALRLHGGLRRRAAPRSPAAVCGGGVLLLGSRASLRRVSAEAGMLCTQSYLYSSCCYGAFLEFYFIALAKLEIGIQSHPAVDVVRVNLLWVY